MDEKEFMKKEKTLTTKMNCPICKGELVETAGNFVYCRNCGFKKFKKK